MISTASITTAAPETVNGYQIPKWASKPPNGLHLDIMKEGKMIQKLMIDEKRYYFFGRNKDVCDFVTDHASCSRCHAVLIWHKHLNRSFLVDLGSAHGTFIGSLRLEPHKPQQVFVDSELRFGASTRTYVIRERPQINKHFPSMLTSQLNTNSGSGQSGGGGEDGNESSFDQKDDLNNSALSMLPESEAELDNLTEFNTAHNKRIAQLVDIASANANNPLSLVKRKKKSVVFNDEEEIINPEDIDPTIGRFRNMIKTSIVIPSKKKRPSQQAQQYSAQFQPTAETMIKRAKLVGDQKFTVTSKEMASHEHAETLYDEDYYEEEHESSKVSNTTSNMFISHLGINKLDLAPDVDNYSSTSISTSMINSTSGAASSMFTKEHDLFKQQHLELINRQYQQQNQFYEHDEEKYDEETSAEGLLAQKKKYAKEAWPGRKPTGAESIPPLTKSPQDASKKAVTVQHPPQLLPSVLPSSTETKRMQI